MKEGSVVTVYEDPYTEEKEEGKAKLLELIFRQAEHDGVAPYCMEKWKVQFLGEDAIFERLIMRRTII